MQENVSCGAHTQATQCPSIINIAFVNSTTLAIKSSRLKLIQKLDKVPSLASIQGG